MTTQTRPKPVQAPDVQFGTLGTFWTATPLSEAAWDWIDDRIPDDALWLGDALAIETRYGADIVYAMRDAGLIVEG